MRHKRTHDSAELGEADIGEVEIASHGRAEHCVQVASPRPQATQTMHCKLCNGRIPRSDRNGRGRQAPADPRALVRWKNRSAQRVHTRCSGDAPCGHPD